MWKVVLPLVPQYLLLGKGYSFDGTDYYLSTQALSHGLRSVYEGAMISNDYHNGFLTLIIPLGIFGFLAFAAFCWGSLRALYANYRYGDPELNRINTFLLAYFIARLVFYLTIYGEFHLDLMIFTGIIGLSLTLNGGVRSKKPAAIQPAIERRAKTLQFQPV
jgi:O-antigen ligase